MNYMINASELFYKYKINTFFEKYNKIFEFSLKNITKNESIDALFERILKIYFLSFNSIELS